MPTEQKNETRGTSTTTLSSSIQSTSLSSSSPITAATITKPSTLTNEQQERMRLNKARALKLAEERRLERGKTQLEEDTNNSSVDDIPSSNRGGGSRKKSRVGEMSSTSFITNNNNISKPIQLNGAGFTVEVSKPNQQTITKSFENANNQQQQTKPQFDTSTQTITITQLTSQYCLTKTDIKNLPFSTIPNPISPKLMPMKLYNLVTIEALSFKKWGGEEGIAFEKRRRERDKFDKALKKSSQNSGDGDGGGVLG